MTPDSTLPSTARPGSSRLAWFLAWLSFWPIALLRAGQLSESDTFWEIRAGQLTFAAQALPQVDTLSWTANGQPWLLNSWAFNLALAAVDALGGLPLVALFGAVLSAAVVAVALAGARRLGAHPLPSAAVVAIAGALLLGAFAVRPQLVDYLAAPALVALLRPITTGARPWRWVWAATGLSVVWANLHSAALLGVAIAGATAAVMLLVPGARRRTVPLIVATVGIGLATLATPYGVQIYLHALSVHQESAGLVREWAAFSPSDPLAVLMLLTGLAALVVAWRRREWGYLAALAVTAVGSILAVRFLPILSVLAIAPLAAAASHRRILDYGRSRRPITVIATSAWLVTICIFSAPSLTHLGRADPSIFPSLHTIAELSPGCRVVNTYEVGGYLSYRRPDILVSIDSRNDLYGAEAVKASADLVDATGDVDGGLAGAGCALLPLDSALASRLTSDPGWRLVTRDDISVLLVRT